MITIALPSRGRLAEPAAEMIAKAGFSLSRTPRTLMTDSGLLTFVFIHPKDAGRYVELGHVDFAITAQDILAEYPANVARIADLEFAHCQIVVAVPIGSSFRSLKDLKNTTIATSHPHLAMEFFREQAIPVSIRALHGALEIAPRLNFCDAIMDSYQTGLSVQRNELRVIQTVMTSQAVLISGNGVIHDNTIAIHFLNAIGL